MLGQVAPTEFDLRFSLFGIPVRVHPGFWLVAAFMGRGALENPELGPAFLVVWIACLFLSILIHELGHALTANYYGWPPEIVLYYLGGYAAYMPSRGHTPKRSILISLAGPGAGFVLYGFVWAFEQWYVRSGLVLEPLVLYTIIALEWINLGWGLVNLLPVLPLDGGRVSAEVCGLLKRRGAFELTLQIGMGVSGAAAAFFFINHESYGLYPGILFAVFCFQNYQMYQSRHGYW